MHRHQKGLEKKKKTKTQKTPDLNNAEIINYLPGQSIFKILKVLSVIEKSLKLTVKFG